MSFSSGGGAGHAGSNLARGFSMLGADTVFQTSIETNLKQAPFAAPKLTAAAALDEYVMKSHSWPSLISYFRDKVFSNTSVADADLTVLRWMNGMFGDHLVESLKKSKKVVWALDDMNPFTGVCHYTGDCRKFVDSCQSCPAVRRPFNGLPALSLQKKIFYATQLGIDFVAPTDWMLEAFRQSAVGKTNRVHKISNPIDEAFLDLPLSKSNRTQSLCVLIAAVNLDDPVKGVWHSINELQKISDLPKVKLRLVGRFSKKLRNALPSAEFLGAQKKIELIKIIDISHVLIVPSLMENAGTIVAEASARGVPAIARNIGGMPEMTNYGQTGLLFNQNQQLYEQVANLEIASVGKLSLGCIDWAQKFHPAKIAQEYINQFLGH